MRNDPARVILRMASAMPGSGHELAASTDHVTVGVEAFEVLAHNDKIDRVPRRCLEPGPAAGGADIGVELERLAQDA